eukprot:gnl/TRDRNA2_/TRDRNA2_98521_c0_seq1.p1 gnl/TRDRNA2_/TRDRNA2_98521_c0~~gnl/TRDRNA2_/TRDRNA2_98521_c0_seq1.p1  ORF type:complete len:398 (+),score=62.80 gnl/TRDRNA2_/TRDRNA2_98521_c0_seq1:62-1195(+)
MARPASVRLASTVNAEATERSQRNLIAGAAAAVGATSALAVQQRKTAEAEPVVSSRLPQHLINELRSGNVIAFVGAGFSLPAGFVGWKNLLLKIAEAAGDETHSDHMAEFPTLPPQVVDAVRACLKSERPSAQEFDMAAQMIDDALHQPQNEKQKEMVAYMRKFLVPKDLPLPEEMRERLRLLRSIKFKAILTTNFNPLICGTTPYDDKVPYRAILRGDVAFEESQIATGFGSSPVDLYYEPSMCPVVQIHGNLPEPKSVVLTTEGYRRLLHGNATYCTFMRSVLATSTVLYMGFSFSDAYLNELRSEIMQVFGDQGPTADPIGYAIINDQSEQVCKSYEKHQGIKLLTWDSQGFSNFAPLREMLAELEEAGRQLPE